MLLKDKSFRRNCMTAAENKPEVGNKNGEKRFKITIYFDKFEAFIPRERMNEPWPSSYRVYRVTGASDDSEVQRWDYISASIPIVPKPGQLVVFLDNKEFRIERYPHYTGKFVATVVQCSKPL
jgi:hypothetical protein